MLVELDRWIPLNMTQISHIQWMAITNGYNFIKYHWNVYITQNMFFFSRCSQVTNIYMTSFFLFPHCGFIIYVTSLSCFLKSPQNHSSCNKLVWNEYNEFEKFFLSLIIIYTWFICRCKWVTPPLIKCHCKGINKAFCFVI